MIVETCCEDGLLENLPGVEVEAFRGVGDVMAESDISLMSIHG